MYFKKLEIFGFKSFADKTILNFEPGITAIVGPNGCGKSNVFDSIRWVLGEQSVKELRGSSMVDVIFNGTEKKPSLGFAEVSLTFCNKSRALAVEENEVTITRRLFRSGESEYLLNKSTVRLKDIHEMLMGTGIGAEAYSLIQQGKVDLVVSAKPEDRRMIFDEASGITKYKAKKKEALNKLKDTENNLLRLNDITIEVKRQIGSIERQANKARRYKEQFEMLKGYEVTSSLRQIKNFSSQKENMTSLLEQMRQQEEKLNADLEELTSTLTNEINSLGDLERKINDVNSKEIKLEGEIDVDSRQIEFNKERSESLSQNEQKFSQQKQQLIERCRMQQEKLEGLKEGLITAEQTVRYSEGKITEKKEALAALERLIQEAKSKIQEHEEKTLELTSGQVNVRNELTDVIKEIQGALARKRRLDLENEKVTAEKSEVDQKLTSIDQQIQNLQETVNQLAGERAAQKQALERSRQECKEVEQKITDLEHKKVFFNSQKDFIEKLHAQYNDMPDPVVEGRFITQTPPLDHHTGIIGKVKNVISLEGERLDELKKTLGQQDAQTLYEIICETKFVELDLEQISHKIEELSAKIAEATAQKEEIEARIAQQQTAYEELELEVQAKEKDLSVFQAQKKDIEEEAKKLIGELELVDCELVEVKETLEVSRKKEEELHYRLDTITQDLAWCQNDIKEQRSIITTKSRDREELTVSVAQLQAEITSQKDKLTSLKENHDIFAKDLDESLEEIKKIDDELAGYDLKREEYAKQNEQLAKKVEATKTEKESLKGVLEDLDRQKQDLSQRINSMRSQIVLLEEQVEELKQSRHSKQIGGKEIEFGQQTIKDRLFQTYKIRLDEQTGEAFELVQESRASDSGDDEESESQEESQPSEGESAPEQTTEGDALENNLEVQASEETQEDDAQEGSQQEAGEDQEQVQEEAVIELPPPQPREQLIKALGEELDEAQLKEEIERLSKKCESFGRVNLVAIEEYEELKERFEFLTQQQADLIEAKSQLLNTIKKINRSTRQMFMDTFTKVSEEFRIYFRMLFGGGEAQLILLDPENVLESGIDIVARPPGKKLQNISLMSGGEKTLTAIALIFGVFKVNPSPFCVLDEIDAALDESNVGRFAYLLKDFAKIAQFIVITHNKKTINSSDVMYGVTMPETGVSRIVSVKLSDGKQEKAGEEVPVGA